jgi:hypothetical protein
MCVPLSSASTHSQTPWALSQSPAENLIHGYPESGVPEVIIGEYMILYKYKDRIFSFILVLPDLIN